MGTRFRTMLAPINASTGDGRRFQTGGITLAPVPFPFEWARAREGGHDGAVVVGVVQEANIGTVKEAVAAGWISAEAAKSIGLAATTEAVWGAGQLFDDASREEMPRLAEDVAEAMHLINAGTLGPSVDLDSFEGIPVLEGTDEPVTWEDIEAHYEEHGTEPKIELLVTEGRVRAATLVSIPAFAETSRPLELVAEESEEPAEAAGAVTVAALIASVAAPAAPDADAFDRPALDGPTPITFDFATGRVFGHIAEWRTCHAGYADVCVTAPKDPGGDYAWFNRYPVETGDGATVWAGRLTVGGRHPGLSLTASATMAQYDGKTVAAHVRAYEDEFGIVVAGVLAPNLTEADRRVLSRRKVSGDWRETPAGLSLVELLALSPGPRQHAEPGFPVATHSRAGRQTALTAALGPLPLRFGARPAALVDTAALAAALADEQERRARLAAERTALAAAVDADTRATVDRTREGLAELLGEE
jgi:hypothetical protein